MVATVYVFTRSMSRSEFMAGTSLLGSGQTQMARSVQYRAMKIQSEVRVRSAERVSRGLIITFDDGKCALYSAALLRDAFPQAEELTETDWTSADDTQRL